MGIGQCDLGNPPVEGPPSQVALGCVTLAVKTEQHTLPGRHKEGREDSHLTRCYSSHTTVEEGGQLVVTSSVITSIVVMTSVWD